MSETTKWGDLPEEEKDRVRTEWKAEQEPQIAKQFEDWQEELIGEAMKRMGQQYGGTLSALSQQGGMAAFTNGMSETEIPFLEKALKDASPENIIAASQDPAVLAAYQNSAKWEAQQAKAGETTETTTETTGATTETTKETQPKVDDKGEPVLDDKGAPVMEEKPPQVSEQVQSGLDWASTHLPDPDRPGKFLELSVEEVDAAMNDMPIEVTA